MEQVNENRMRLRIEYSRETDFLFSENIPAYANWLEKKLALLQPPVSVINWILFSEQQPPDIVEDYITCDTEDNIKTLEWYEGDSFANCSGGHWSDENGNEVTNVVLWAKKPVLRPVN